VQNQNIPHQHRLLRCAATRAKAGFTANSTLYSAMELHGFPRPVKIGLRSVAWVESEVDDWVRSRIAARDAGPWQSLGDAAARVVKKL
jgi:prophage regulatory protein